jgi:nucleoside-diphosphate-sugar epimerase
MGELLFFIYQKEYKMDIVITRPSRIYGPLYNPLKRNPIMRMALAAIKGGKADFTQVNEKESHDFVYVRDCARAISIIHLDKRPKQELYNIGLGKVHSFGDVARTLEKIVPGSSFKLGSGEVSTLTKTEYDIHACLDNSRIQEEFGYVPKYDLEKGLSALVVWLRDGSYI